MKKIKSHDLEIKRLGLCQFKRPDHLPSIEDSYIKDEDTLLFYSSTFENKRSNYLEMERAGRREKLFFDSLKAKAAIVSCGGLCPGINDVIRALVMTLTHRYGVHSILGIPYGYQGFIPEYDHEIISLNPQHVSLIHKHGGSLLGTSRGRQDTQNIVNFLKNDDIQMLFVIGGDGTMRCALEVSEEIEKQGLSISVIGIPKTIDNDILYIDRSFGFETAFSEAVKAVNSANNEARGAPNGIGLVKVMGRHSGFIASFAALAMNDVNFVLIPEVPFSLDRFLEKLKQRIEKYHHAVIVVAEGSAQELMSAGNSEKDASGNIRFSDIGLFLKEKIKTYFKQCNLELNLKYIDPSYILRSVPATAQDSVYCLRLAENAVHAAMSGRTQLVIAKRQGHYVHLPMKLISSGRKKVDPQSDLWLSVLAATGQDF